MSKLLKSIFMILLLTAHVSEAFPDAESDRRTLAIHQWLLLGPFSTPSPALHKELKTGNSIEGLVKFQQIEIANLKPQKNRSFRWHDGSSAQWITVDSGEQGLELPTKPGHPSIAYLGFYLDIKRWTQAKLTLSGPQALRVCLDGESIGVKSRKDSSQEGRVQERETPYSWDMILETGKHWIVIKTANDPSSNPRWFIKGHLSLEDKYADPPPAVTLDPKEVMSLQRLLDGPKPSDISISPDGKLAALTIRRTLPPGNTSESWVELYDLEKNRLSHTFRGKNALSSVTWASQGAKFSYATFANSKGTIWVVDMEQGTTLPILEDQSNLGDHTWSPDGDYIIYSVREKGKEDTPGFKRYQGLPDRQPQWRDRSFLFKVTIPEGVRQRLTAGEFTTSLNAISPDGQKLLFTRTMEDLTQRPYSQSELHMLDLNTLGTELIWKGPWLGSAHWLPNENRLLCLGGPSLFGEIGHDVTEGVIPNEYDTQAYILDLDSMDVEAITKDFDPAVNQVFWYEAENCLFVLATDKSYIKLYQYNFKRKSFSLVETGVDVIHALSVAREDSTAVYIGSSAADPPKAYAIDLAKQKYRVLNDPSAEDYADVRFGAIKRWTFNNAEGVEIEGRIYYPADFDPHKKYPCIVNYYGGTTPVSRSFGGRYPLNLYAAQGYIVYVMQPSGAIGFGQAFSSRHVNDWGIIVADEIVRGVQKFLDAHAFVDPERLGCIGASYGGFMTMLLQTRTNLFSAAIAHAGISSIASYWGEGYWGYSYSALATANSFPWNRKDIYVNQSPLFHADKISTPLLLLHGSVDTNVPPGESTQLFTALKLLGREVEYIQILDQNHHIMTYDKRILWTKTILAWFDRWLKRQPEWWQHLYPDN